MRRLIVVIAVLGLMLSALPAFAWTGILSTPTHPNHASHDGSLVYGGGWEPALLSWDVTQVNSNVYRYEYTLEIASTAGGDISHMILELTDDDFYRDFTYPSMDMFNLERWDGQSWVPWAPILNVDKHKATIGGANPDMPTDMWGVKFDELTGMSITWRFDAYRLPVWGDFYSKDGGAPGAEKYLYNAGFALADPADPPSDGSINDHILRPNGRTPELAPSILMGMSMLPFGIAYVRGRRRRET
ncbi:MAG: hypothetical protein ACOX9R_13595 [Armatimonadota bacterium]|jgi:hypothetical protein